MARGMNCAAHKHVDLVPIEKHHVWPLGYHGPDTEANKEPLCANAHSDVHYLMERWLKKKHVDLREFGPGVRNIAKRGYDQVIAYAQAHAQQIVADRIARGLEKGQ